MKGRVIQEITQHGVDELIFTLKGGGVYKMFYEPD